MPEPQARPADGIPAYLEASDERTRRIYLRHGYADYGSPIRLPDGPKQASARRAWSHQPPLKGRPPRPVLLAARGVRERTGGTRVTRSGTWRSPRTSRRTAGRHGDLANALETRFESGVLLPAPVLARVHHGSQPTITLTFRILAATGAVVLTAEGFQAV